MQNNKNTKLIKIIGITSVIHIVIICVLYFYSFYIHCYKAKLTVGTHKISEAEYEYYYNSYYKYYMNNFSQFFDYMGVDPDKDLLSQEYDNGMSFGQMFEECTLDQIKEIYSLYDEAKANDFVYDTEEIYDGYIKTVNDSLNNSDSTLDDYFKSNFGQYITVSLAKKYLCTGYYALSYYNKLVDELGQDNAYNKKQELKNKMEVVFY